ncbi:hypothetical protein GCM10012275_34530 [Longimycelium tulufanense]|uniref:Transcriptional regulator n=1 Tax=Longimycelium tulufanense TaxID=907463 RepID=A0A8J3CG40_9PSEU|nr:metal-sensitive transcriptional regulator [Longimycelium tulufanense]GGM60529.1 hypothetical protein GCM10012275_34530 [Longimycelium tulufanense]
MGREVRPATPGNQAQGREMMDQDTLADCLGRLAKVAGQVQGVARMLEQGRYCVDVLNQISAIHKALDAVGERVTRNYLERCVREAIEAGDPLIYDEVMRVIYRRSR